MKTFKLNNVPAPVYAQIAKLNCTLLQKAQLIAAVGVQTLVKVPTVLLNRAGEFLCSVYDISSEEFVNMGEAIKPDTQEGDVGVLAIGKAALRTPFVVIRHAGRLIYRVVLSAAENLVGIFKDLMGVARDTKATLLCRFDPEGARVILEQLKDELNDEEVARFMTACGDEALESLQDAALEAAGVKPAEVPTNFVVLAQTLKAELEAIMKKGAVDVDTKVRDEIRKQLCVPMVASPAPASAGV